MGSGPGHRSKNDYISLKQQSTDRHILPLKRYPDSLKQQSTDRHILLLKRYPDSLKQQSTDRHILLLKRYPDVYPWTVVSVNEDMSIRGLLFQ
jgi:hypothetical protein